MIFEIAGGIILALALLCLLVLFARPLAMLFLGALGIGAVGAVLWLAIKFLIGLWNFVHGVRFKSIAMADTSYVVFLDVSMVVLIMAAIYICNKVFREKPGTVILSPNDPRLWLTEPVTWLNQDYASDENWNRLVYAARSVSNIYGVRLRADFDGMTAMRAIAEADRLRDLSYTLSEGCIYAWRRRA